MKKDESNKSFVNETRLWLKIIKKNRIWLAEKIGVSPSAVSSWLYSGRHVPELHKATVKMLMKERASLKQSVEHELKRRRYSQIFVEMDEETLDVVARAAASSGFSFYEWISYAARMYSEHVLDSIRRREYGE